MSPLSEKEHLLLNLIRENPRGTLSQKILSEKSGVSVGLINAVLKTMIAKGYVKAKTINKKKLRYLVTRKGSSQIIRKSYHSILNTIRSYRELELTILTTVSHISQMSGKKKILVIGDGDLAELVHRVAKKQLEPDIQIVSQPPVDDHVVLDLSGQTSSRKTNTVSLLRFLNDRLTHSP